MSKRRKISSLTGIVTDRITRKPIGGINVGMSGTKTFVKTSVDGAFELEVLPGNYRLQIQSIKTRPTLTSNTIKLGLGKHTCEIIVDFVKGTILVDLKIEKNRNEKLCWNEPIILLPLSLQIRKIVKGNSYSLAPLEKDELQPDATPSGLFRPFKQSIVIERPVYDHDEYWIRWFPDELHFANPVGRITETEKKAWQEFYSVFEGIQGNHDENEAITSFINNLENPELDWGALNLTGIDTSTRISQVMNWLQVFYNFRHGLLTVVQIAFCQRYDTFVKERINAGEIGYREVFEWRDMENPNLKTAWIKYAKEVGSDRARQISKYMQYGREWDFDTIYPFTLAASHVNTLVENILSDGLRGELQAHGDFAFSDNVTLVKRDDGWIVSDEQVGQELLIKLEGTSLNVYNVKGEEEEPLEILMDRGSRLDTLPELVSLYAIKGNTHRAIRENIKVERDKILIGPTELEGTHWMTDFNQAILVGMGAKIAETEQVQLIDECDWLVVCGINATRDTRNVLEEIIRRNQAKGDFGIVGQDTPTNNTEQSKTAHAEIREEAEQLLDDTRTNVNATELNSSSYIQLLQNGSPDALKLHTMFKMQPTTFSEIQGSALREQTEAVAMNVLVWNSLSQVVNLYLTALSPIFEFSNQMDSSRTTLKRFFIEHVRGRGTYPIIKLGSNPYGILPVLPVSQYVDSVLSPDKGIVYNRLRSSLTALKSLFQSLSEETLLKLQESAPENQYEDLLEILRQTAVSQKLECSVVELKNTIDFWNLDYSEAKKVSCPLVTDIVMAEGDFYPFYRETRYLDELFRIESSSSSLSEIVGNSPVLKRIVVRAIQSIDDKAEVLELRLAADVLRRVNPEKLEILLLETLDVLSHRLDAWLTGIADLQLTKIIAESEKPPPVGVYGWLESPGKMDMSSALPEFIYCPSDQHAVGASILRSASLTTNPSLEKQAFQINLSSSQVRKGLWFLEGIRKGYMSEELLGYQLERMIKDEAKNGTPGITPLDIYTLREKYPLKVEDAIDEGGNNAARTTTIDGERFISENSEPRLQKLRDNLNSIKDAGADIAISEIVFQQGNADRQAAWMDFLDGKVIPPEPEFVKTKRTGSVERTKIFLSIDPPASLTATQGTTNPRIIADPVFSSFCSEIIGDLSDKQIKITVSRHSDWTRELLLVASQLDVAPIDLVIGGKEELINRIRYHVIKQWQISNPSDPTSPFFTFGEFPTASAYNDDPLTEVSINLVKPVSASEFAVNIFAAINSAEQIRKLILNTSNEGRFSLNPFEANLKVDRLPEDIDTDATVCILEERVIAIKTLYLELLLSLIEHAVGPNFITSNQATLLKLRRLLGSVKEEENESLTATVEVLSRVWAKLFSENSSLADSATDVTEKINNISSDPTTIAKELIDQFFDLERSVTTSLILAISDMRPQIEQTLIGLSRIGILRSKTLYPAEINEKSSSAFLRNLYDVLKSTFEKIDPLLSISSGLKAKLNTLKISWFNWNEIKMVLDSVEFTDESWGTLVVDKLQNQLRLPVDTAENIKDLLLECNCNFKDFISNQVSQIRARDFPVEYAPESDSEIKINYLIRLLKEATDKEATPILQPYLLKPDASGNKLWRIEFPPEISSTEDRLMIYSKVRSQVSTLMDVRSDFEQFKLFELAAGLTGESGQGNLNCIYFSTNGTKNIISPFILILDSWQETIPNLNERPSIALQFESPATEAPNILIVAVPPKRDQSIEWTTGHLVETIKETIVLMKIRMVDSEKIKETPFLGNFLPASLYIHSEPFVPTLLKLIFTDTLSRYVYTNASEFTVEQLIAMNNTVTTNNTPPSQG